MKGNRFMTATYLAQADDHQVLEWVGDSTLAILLDAASTAGQLTLARVISPQGAAAPYHVHANEDEMFFMISGSALLWSGEEQHELHEGGIAFLPRDIPHCYRITSDRADFLLLATPGGMEGMFRKAGRDLSQPRPDDFEMSPATMAEALAEFGQKIVGPPR
jgi:quercetin dioxygenase-like cupin family protein